MQYLVYSLYNVVRLEWLTIINRDGFWDYELVDNVELDKLNNCHRLTSLTRLLLSICILEP